MVVQDQDNLFSGPLTKDSVSLEWQTVMEKIVCGGFEPRMSVLGATPTLQE